MPHREYPVTACSKSNCLKHNCPNNIGNSNHDKKTFDFSSCMYYIPNEPILPKRKEKIRRNNR